jgi:iron complex outermembrane recepter protein
MKTTTTRGLMLATTIISGMAFAAPAFAQTAPTPAAAPAAADIVVVTGTRITAPGVQSASPITSIGGADLQLTQVAEPEKLLRSLPSTIPGDGENVNNGTAGVTSINMRGLGARRNLVLMDGKRMTPYNINGIVDVSSIPQAMLERIDILTGGASTVYGSDAMSGVINFVLKKDFEGVEVDLKRTITGDNDGQIVTASAAIGANLDDGRGNVALSMNWTKRDPVTLAARAFGIVNVDSDDGPPASGLAAAPANCSGPNAIASGGSSTTIPARVSYMGGNGQFREDGTFGANCSTFNFNPYNYYQTPQERYSTTAIARYDINDHVEAYARATFAATNIRQQIAPSGVFGNLFFVPLNNPYLPAAARATIIAQAEAFRANPLNSTAGRWNDLNRNGVVDAADELQISIRRRTVELGERSTTFDNNTFQVVAGLKGDLGTFLPEWTWDASVQMGQADRTNVSAGYTNVTNIQNALRATNTTTCLNGDATCVPINLFGPFGSITPAQAAYSSGTALEQQNYTQSVAGATVGGPVYGLKSPAADSPVSVVFGYEYRNETGKTTPDECLKVAPTSCLGGAGGNTLPVAGGFTVNEVFTEVGVPLVSGKPLFESLSLELGYRVANYSVTGQNTTWKAGVDWALTDQFRFRAMQQKAARAPNVGELFAPFTTGLQNSGLDPCSSAQPLAGRTTALRAICQSTGQSAGAVWNVQNIVVGQVGTFEGSDPTRPPAPEEADTTTIGFVWRPSFGGFFKNSSVTLDYYDIKVNKYIGLGQPQEVLDGCYIDNKAEFCSLIVRINGDLATPGSGIRLLTTNLDYRQATGFELGISTKFDLESLGFDSKWGSISISYNANLYTKNESRTNPTSDVIDCNGFYGTSCDPVHKYRSTQRTTWSVGDFQLSYNWRHSSAIQAELAEAPDRFPAFRQIKAYDYIDLSGSWDFSSVISFTASVTNATDKAPPIVGNTIGTTAYNSGNTFPSNFDVLGRVYGVGVNVKF